MEVSTDYQGKQANKKSCSNTYTFYFKTIPQLNASYFIWIHAFASIWDENKYLKRKNNVLWSREKSKRLDLHLCERFRLQNLYAISQMHKYIHFYTNGISRHLKLVQLHPVRSSDVNVPKVRIMPEKFSETHLIKAMNWSILGVLNFSRTWLKTIYWTKEQKQFR